MKLIIDDSLKCRWNIKEKLPGIYIITNTVNSKKYVGATNNVRKRFSDYNGKSKMESSNRPIYKAIKEYGQNNFVFEFILYDNSFNTLGEMEQFYINKYDSIKTGYNEMNSNGGGLYDSINKSLSHIGLKDSNETKRKKIK